MSKLTKRDAQLLARVVPRLTARLDRDLWQQQPGRDERFDVDRFGEWLETLVDAGESAAAHLIAALDRNLVVAGLSRYVRVFDPGIFEPVAHSDDERIEPHDAMREGDSVMTRDWSAARLTCDVGGYIVRGRRDDAWDAIIALLLALDSECPDDFHALMRACRALSNSRPEIGGTDDLLMAPEQHLHDVAIERDQRRSEQGYATAAEARAFLQMARLPKRIEEQHHFGSVDALMPRTTRLPLLTQSMQFLKHRDETTCLTRGGDLAFLANTLLSGCSVQSRPFTPQEASDAAASICNLGLECWPGSSRHEFLVDHDLVSVFEVGWSVLYRDVTLFAVDQLIGALQRLRSFDADTRLGLYALQRQLAKYREAGTPWLARDAAEVLAMLDMTAWVSVLGLLDECPVLPAALTAVLEGRTTCVSANDFEFISTRAQIGDVRVFMSMLPGVLSR